MTEMDKLHERLKNGGAIQFHVSLAEPKDGGVAPTQEQVAHEVNRMLDMAEYDRKNPIPVSGLDIDALSSHLEKVWKLVHDSKPTFADIDKGDYDFKYQEIFGPLEFAMIHLHQIVRSKEEYLQKRALVEKSTAVSSQ